LGVSAPAMAACHVSASASSNTESCENGVKVYRGQQNGPDIRYAILQQNRDIADARARAAEARARSAESRRAPVTVNQTNNGNNRTFGRNFLVPQARFGFQNFRNASVPQVGGGFPRSSLVGRSLNRSLNRGGTGSGLSVSVGSSSGLSLPGSNARPPLGAVPGARGTPLRGGN